MPYPTNWAQIVVCGPNNQHPTLIETFTSWNFLFTGTLTSPFDIFFLYNDFGSWYQSWLGALQFSQNLNLFEINAYVNFPSGLVSHWQYANSLFVWTPLEVLPSYHGIILQTFAVGTTRRDRGRVRLPGIPKVFMHGSRLNGFGTFLWDNAISLFTPSFTSQGLTYTLVIPSFADGTAKPVLRVAYSARPGVIRRRQKPHRGVLRPPPFPLPP